MRPFSTAVTHPQRALHALYSDHHSWLYGWLRKRLENRCDAADLAQDTFMRILVSQHPNTELQLAEPRAYLVTVAKRLMFNHFRRQSLERAYLEALAQLPEQATPSLEDHALILEALNEVDAVLNTLPTKVRKAFLLSQLEGLTYAQIADALKVNVRTVNRYMVQAVEACIMLSAKTDVAYER